MHGVSKYAHAGSRTRVTSMGGLYDAATLHALCIACRQNGLLLQRFWLGTRNIIEDKFNCVKVLDNQIHYQRWPSLSHAKMRAERFELPTF